jgi:hypothetical protein
MSWCCKSRQRQAGAFSEIALEWERKDDHIVVALPGIQGYQVVEVR